MLGSPSPTEPSRFSDPDIFPTQLTQDSPRLLIPDTPGLGVEVNEKYICQQKFKFWEAPHLCRRDGLYTNLRSNHDHR
jgi:galactonate dehydratase